MKIVWHSPPVWLQTGYGIQSFYFTKALQELGHEVKLATNCQLVASPIITYNGIPHYPSGFQVLGMDGLLHLCQEWKPDIVISLMDIWPLPENFGAQIEATGAGGWFPYAPVDHEPCPPVIAARLKHASMPLAMSQFTVRAMTDANVGRVPWYLPHVVDTSIYRPLMDTKPTFDPKKFVVGMVAMNLSSVDRKGFQPAIRTFAKFEKNHPDALLYIHANPFKTEQTGQDLIGLALACGTTFARPDPRAMEWGVPPTVMAELYNGFDVLLAPSKGEGFGIPLIEAQACGTPVITTDFTATAELGRNGWLIPVAGKDWMGASSWQARPDEDAMLNALEEAYDMKHTRADEWLDKKVASFDLAQDYSVPTVIENNLIPFLEIVQDALRKPKKQENRQVVKKRHQKSKHK